MIPRIPVNIYVEKDNKIWCEDEPIDAYELNKYIGSEGKIFFGEDFNQPLNFLTNDVEWIIFTDGCNITHCLSENLPNTIVGIVFTETSSYDSNFDNLPNSIKYLVFKSDAEFNSPIDNLPNSLIYLELSTNFSQPLSCLPQFL